MPLIAAHEIDVKTGTQPIYNGFDNCLTFEIDNARQKLNQNDTLIYDFERAMQAPAMEMMLRGFRVDIDAREKAIMAAEKDKEDTDYIIEEIVTALKGRYTDKFCNSQPQLHEFFYDQLGLKPIVVHVNGEKKYPLDRESLEKLSQQNKFAEVVVNAILLRRDLTKTLQVLKTGIEDCGSPTDPFNWRWKCSYNIGGTKTGRWSSSKSPFLEYDEAKQKWIQLGSNFQNVTEELRRIFIPDPGYKLYGIDKAQSEARDFGWMCGLIFNDWSYLDICESGDLHTNITRMLYPEWSWTKDPKTNRALADRRFYRTFTYRDASKRLGHACLTDDHEVLTPSGWTWISDKPEIIMQWKDGESKFVRVKNWTDDLYTGTLHEFDGASISIRMTHNHRVPYKKDRRYGVCTKLAEDGPGKLMPLGDNYIGGDEEVPARLIAAFMSDGSQSSLDIMDFQFKKERKATRLQALCKLYNYEITEGKGREGVYRFYVKGRLPKKAGSFMLQWTKKSIEDFLDEYKYWDGSIKESSQQTLLYSTDKEHLKWIQTLGRICGIGGVIFTELVENAYNGPTLLYKLSQNIRLFAGGQTTKWTKRDANRIRVLCPTVESGYFYVRRNGRIIVTGNSNYYGKPAEISKQTRIPLHLVEEFQKRYFATFPCIPMMHQWVAAQLQKNRFLVNSFGRRRDFFDHPKSNDTLKGAIAYLFQSATGDCLNLGLYRLWKNMGRGRIQILSQLHDAVYFQAPIPTNDEDEAALLREAVSNIQVAQHHKKSGRTMTIPGEVVGGFNWAHRYRLLADGRKEEWNPRGLDGIRIAA